MISQFTIHNLQLKRVDSNSSESPEFFLYFWRKVGVLQDLTLSWQLLVLEVCAFLKALLRSLWLHPLSW